MPLRRQSPRLLMPASAEGVGREPRPWVCSAAAEVMVRGSVAPVIVTFVTSQALGGPAGGGDGSEVVVGGRRGLWTVRQGLQLWDWGGESWGCQDHHVASWPPHCQPQGHPVHRSPLLGTKGCRTHFP